MKIYTKQGDQGQTGLFGGSRVPKDHQRIEAYGTVDELNSVIGLCRGAVSGESFLSSALSRIQSELFQLGAELATPAGKDPGIQKISESHIAQFENEIDQMESKLPALRSFVLPGGTELAARLHLARTVTRRAERGLVSLQNEEPQRPELLKYLNRLSDFLFVAARFANHEAGQADTPWIAPKN